MAVAAAVCDYLVIGGGASGCVMAARLSEDSSLRVRLIEAGQVYAPDREPPAIADILARSCLNPAFTWQGLTTIPDPDPHHPDGGVRIPYIHGRVLGGGSAVNGMNAHRGLPQDYDEWSTLGVAGWDWASVLPYFRKLEQDVDFDGDGHGRAGPITIMRWPRERWSRFEQAVDDDWGRRKLPFVDDLNGPRAAGRFPVSLAASDGRRMSAARAYLTEAVRMRPNLEILGQAEVQQLLVEDGRVAGVSVVRGGRSDIHRARHVILCAGAFATPTLLMRAGIGDARALAAEGIDVRLDRPGVGANLQNHPSLMLTGFLHRTARTAGHRPMTTSCARYSSGIDGCDDTDMINVTLGMAPDATAPNPLGRRLGSLLTIVNKVHSRGMVLPTRSGHPKVIGNMFADERDLDRLIVGFRIIREQFEALRATGLVDQVFLPTGTGRTDDSTLTTVLNRLAAVALDSHPRIRENILAQVGIPLRGIPSGGPGLRDWVRRHNNPGYHASGTCRMGRRDDPAAVVDSDGRLIGMPGLSLADASIFPTLMRAGTYIPVVMAAEKIADRIKADRRHLDPD